MVENDPAACRALEQFRALVGASAVEIVRGDALEYLARSRERFDLVFLDPPFRQNALPVIFRHLHGTQGMRVYVEASEPFAPGSSWEELKRGRAGQVSYQLFQWRGDDQGGLSGNV
jgi:16S rRNA (guanine966-N2)-methyltransferase